MAGRPGTVLASALETSSSDFSSRRLHRDWQWHLLLVRPETVRHRIKRGGDRVRGWPLGRGQMTKEREGALALFPVPINSCDEIGCARLGEGSDLPAD